MSLIASQLEKLPELGQRLVRGNRGLGSGPLVGIDMASGEPERRGAIALPCFMAGLIAALSLTGLRIEILRLEYESAEAQKLEQRMQEEKRALTVEMRRLRAPARLGMEARALGFQHPDQVIELQRDPTSDVAAAPLDDGV